MHDAAQVLTRDKKYLISSDRDEKIRVSRYPHSFVIESYLLGHTDYIAGFQVIEQASPLLVSGSGDGTLRLWNMLSGAELQCITLSENGEQTVVPVAYDSASELLLVVLEGYLSGAAAAHFTRSLTRHRIGAARTFCIIPVSPAPFRPWWSSRHWTLATRSCIQRRR